MVSHPMNVRLYKDEDEKDYLKLMNSVFPRYKCELERWRWEFRENPFGFLQVFVDSDGKTVGTMSLIGASIKVDGTVFKGSQAVDLAVRPEFRGRGLFLEMGKKIMEQAKNEGFVLSYGVPNESAYYGHLKYGWFPAAEIPVLTKMISKKALALFTLARLRDLFNQRRLRSISNIFVLTRNLGENVRVLARDKRTFHSGFTKRIVKVFDEQFDRLWEETSVRHPLLIVRNSGFLNWRYIRRPFSNYMVLAIERNSTLEGYVILSTEVRDFAGWKKGYIVDILAKSEDGIDFLIQIACDYFAEANVDVAICWMMKGQRMYSEYLAKHGFTNDAFSSQKLICRINSSDDAFGKLYHSVERNWFFTMGDSDVV